MTDPAPFDLVLDYDLDAAPQKVWRAIATREVRRRWLPDDALADPVPIQSVPEREVRYRLREKAPPFSKAWSGSS